MFVAPVTKPTIPSVKRSNYKWYDTNYFCSKCDKFFPLEIMIPSKNNKVFHCGVCQDRRYKVRLKTRGKRY